MNAVIAYMRERSLPMLVSVYCEINWMGQTTLADLEGEELQEVLDLVESGELNIEAKGSSKIQ